MYLNSHRVASIAVVSRAELISSPSSRIHMRALEHARQLIERDGFRPVIKTGHGRTPEEFVNSIHLLDSFVAKEIVGVLMLVELGELDERLAKVGIPAVSVVSGAPVDPYTVTLDYTRMGQIGREMLKSAGHDQFVLMYPEDPPGETGKPLAREWQRMRLEMVDGDQSRLLPYQFSYDHRYAYNAFKSFWLSGRRPGAVFFWDDAAFDVASRAILELGIDVPGELALVTQGNANVYYHFPIPVTCVEFDCARAVAAAWEMLDRRISGEKIGQPIIQIEPNVRPGETLKKNGSLAVGALAVGDR